MAELEEILDELLKNAEKFKEEAEEDYAKKDYQSAIYKELMALYEQNKAVIQLLESINSVTHSIYSKFSKLYWVFVRGIG